MFGFGGNHNGPGGGSTNSGSAPSGGGNYGGPGEGVGGGPGGPGGSVGKGLGSGSSSGGKSYSGKGGQNSPGEGAGGGPGGPSGTSGSKERASGSGSMERARSFDRAGVTGYAGDSKTHEQDVAEAHADRQTGVGAPGQRMSTNVEGMTAYDFAARRARQVGGLIDQTNIALRSNDLMSPFSIENTWDTRYRPQSQAPVSTAMEDGTALSLYGGRLHSFDPVDLGTYRTSLPEIDYSMPTAAQAEIDRRERMYPSGPPGLPANFADFASRYLGASPNSSGGMSPSEINAQGREGTNSGPGNPSASGSAPGKGDRVDGGYSVGNVDPARFGGSTPTGFSPDIDPTRFGGALSTTTGDRVTRGFGAAIPDRTFRDAEDASMSALDRMRSTDMAEARRTSENAVTDRMMAGAAIDRMTKMGSAEDARTSENTSMGLYSAAAANSAANATRADTTSTARAAENTSMKDMATWGKQVKSVKESGPGWTSVELNDGTVEKRAGDRAARNNNPGNIMAGPFADSMGAIGNDFATPADIAAGRKRGFAVFGTKADGLKAQAGWFAKEAKRNPDMTLGQAISKYAPAFENNTAAYTAALAKAGGITRDTKVSEINPSQMESMLTAQLGVEGNTGFKMAEVSPATKNYGDVRSYPDTATRFASTYLGKDDKQIGPTGYDPAKNPANARVAAMFGDNPEQGDQAAPQEASYTPDPSLTEFPDRPRSNFEKIAAAGLDIGGGLLPGIGLGVGLINGGLSLTGNRTIGTRIVDAIATGKGGKGAPIKGDPQREYQVADTTIPVTTHTTVPTVDKFVDSYLSPPDATKYPTPYQKYDLGRDSYAGA